MSTLFYRPEIDGLRFFAVIPVVLYHILPALCPGGFAGVDVFFVISGFLITSGILRDLEKGQFTIRAFYYRRIRRIMPAYFMVILGVFVAGCVIYYSTPLLYLSDTVIAGTLFSANFYFNVFSGNYFAPEIHDNALLHLWSLSVEEQFYIFVPLICAFIWKWRRDWVRSVFIFIAIVSFAWATYAIHSGRTVGAFYLLHYRAWELLAGSILSMVSIRSLSVDCTRKESTFSWLGFILICAPYVFLNSASSFPGLAALPSVLGTVLIIRYGTKGAVNQLLCSKALVFIGKISYSLYLWHWPVIVFWRYVVYDQLTWSDYLGMGCVSFVLAFISWRLIEGPVRKSSYWTPRRCFVATGSGMILLLCIGSTCILTRGWPQILHPEANCMSSNEFPARVERLVVGAKVRILNFLGKDVKDDFRLHFGSTGHFALGAENASPQFLLIGDSHAGHLQHGFDVLLKCQNKSAYSINVSDTWMFDVEGSEIREVQAWLAENKSVKTVMISSLWVGHHQRMGDDMFLHLDKFFDKMKSMNLNVVLLTDIPTYKKAPSDIAARAKICIPREKSVLSDNLNQSNDQYESRQGYINQKLSLMKSHLNVTLIPAHLALFDGQRFFTFIDRSGTESPQPLYRDEHHLSSVGSEVVAKFILDHLNSGYLK